MHKEEEAFRIAQQFAGGKRMPDVERWVGKRFDGGWIFGPPGDDGEPAVRAGLRWIVVVDDGRVGRVDSTTPTTWLIERFSED